MGLEDAVDLPIAELIRRAAVVRADGQFVARVSKAMEQRYPPFEPSQVVESRMYEGFPSRTDENRMQAFHLGDWHKRAEITETMEDDRYRELARRLVFENAPEALANAKHEQLQAWLQNRRCGREGVETGRTIGDAISELEEVPQSHEAEVIMAWLESLEA